MKKLIVLIACLISFNLFGNNITTFNKTNWVEKPDYTIPEEINKIKQDIIKIESICGKIFILNTQLYGYKVSDINICKNLTQTYNNYLEINECALNKIIVGDKQYALVMSIGNWKIVSDDPNDKFIIIQIMELKIDDKEEIEDIIKILVLMGANI